MKAPLNKSFVIHDKNTSTHYLSSTAVFTKTENIPYYSEKSTLCLSRDRRLRQSHFAKKFFMKCSRITMNHSLHSIPTLHEFRQFSFLFANSVQQVYLVINFTTKILVLKFSLYDLHFLRYPQKTNLKPILWAKIWHQKFCTANGRWDFKYVILGTQPRTFLQSPIITPKILGSIFFIT